MTEAMPFLQKTILLSYDPRSSAGVLLAYHLTSCSGGLAVPGARHSAML